MTKENYGYEVQDGCWNCKDVENVCCTCGYGCAEKCRCKFLHADVDPRGKCMAYEKKGRAQPEKPALDGFRLTGGLITCLECKVAKQIDMLAAEELQAPCTHTSHVVDIVLEMKDPAGEVYFALMATNLNDMPADTGIGIEGQVSRNEWLHLREDFYKARGFDAVPVIEMLESP